MQKDVQVTVVGKVFRPNWMKFLALNRTLSKYLILFKWYNEINEPNELFNNKSYENTKQLFDLNTAQIQTAGDKAVEILKNFKDYKKARSVPRPNKIYIRFDKRCYSFSKTTNVLTPHWLILKKKEGVSFPITFGMRQKRGLKVPLKESGP